MKTFLVTCTKRHALHERIESIGCIDTTTLTESRFSEAEAIKQIETRAACFSVRDERGNEAVVEVEEREGRKFLITKRDHVKTDNLQALPACSAVPIVVPPPSRPVPPARSHAVHANWELL